MTEPRQPRTPRERNASALAWGAATAVLTIALEVFVWGIASLVLDRDVLPEGLPLLAGPGAIIAAALVTGSATFVAVRRQFAEGGASRFDPVLPLVAGLLGGAAHLLVILVSASADGGGGAVTPLGFALGHATSAFGLPVPILVATLTFVAQAMVGSAVRRDGDAPPP